MLNKVKMIHWEILTYFSNDFLTGPWKNCNYSQFSLVTTFNGKMPKSIRRIQVRKYFNMSQSSIRALDGLQKIRDHKIAEVCIKIEIIIIIVTLNSSFVTKLIDK